MRHGPTHARCLLGWSDLPADLSDADQIARTAGALPAGAPVISSDLSRAVGTADAIAAGRFRLPHDPDLREINFGRWEGMAFAEAEAADPCLFRAFYDDPGDARAPEGESWREASERVDRAADRLVSEHRGGDVIVVSHMGAILSQVQRATGLASRDVFARRIENFAVTELRFDGRWLAGGINILP